MIPIGYYIEWVLWLILWIVLAIISWKTPVFTRFHGNGNKFLTRGLIVKNIAICFTVPHFIQQLDNNGRASVAVSGVAACMFQMSLYLAIMPLIVEKYWQVLDTATLESFAILRIKFSEFDRKLRILLGFTIVGHFMALVIYSIDPTGISFVTSYIGSAVFLYTIFCVYRQVKDFSLVIRQQIDQLQDHGLTFRRKRNKLILKQIRNKYEKMVDLSKTAFYMLIIYIIMTILLSLALIQMIQRQRFFTKTDFNAMMPSNGYYFDYQRHVWRSRSIFVVLMLIKYYRHAQYDLDISSDYLSANSSSSALPYINKNQLQAQPVSQISKTDDDLETARNNYNDDTNNNNNAEMLFQEHIDDVSELQPKPVTENHETSNVSRSSTCTTEIDSSEQADALSELPIKHPKIYQD